MKKSTSCLSLLLGALLLASCDPQTPPQPGVTPPSTGGETVPDAGRLTGTVEGWKYGAGQVLFYSNGTLSKPAASSSVSSDGRIDVALPSSPPTELLIGDCTFTGTRTVPDIRMALASAALATPAGDVLGELREKYNGRAVARQYSDQNATFRGTVDCGTGDSLKLDVQFVKGWNKVFASISATGLVIASLPQGAVTSFGLALWQARGPIVFTDESALSLKLGETVQREVTIFQEGGLSGDITFETNVSGVLVRPVTLNLPPLASQALGGQAVRTTLTFEADASASPYQGDLTVYALKDGVRVGQGTLPFFTLQIPYVMPTIGAGRLEIAQGEQQTVSFDVISQGGFSGPTQITLGNLPAGLSASTATVTLTPGGSARVTLTVTAAPDAPTGFFSANITGPRIQTFQGGMDSVPVTVLPARIPLTSAVTQVFPASQGIWVRTWDGALQQVRPGQVLASYPLKGFTSILPAPGGQVVVISQSVSEGIASYTVSLYGSAGLVSTVVSSASDGDRYGRGAVDAASGLWFMRGAASGESAATLTRLDLTTGQTREIGTNVFTGTEDLHGSPDGRYIAIPSGTGAQALTLLETTTSLVRSITPSRDFDGGGYAVSNAGEVYKGGLVLTRLSPEGEATIYRTPEGGSVSLIGFDQTDPDILWVEANDQLRRFSVAAGQFTTAARFPSMSYIMGAPAGQGGVGIITNERVYSGGNLTDRWFAGFIK